MPHQELERTLQDLVRVGTLIAREKDLQIWQFEHGGRPYLLRFHERPRSRFSRRGNRAVREFHGLTTLQRINVPAPRAIALLAGFRLKISGANGGETIGDAVVVEKMDSAIRLDEYLAGFDARGEPVPDRSELARQLRTIVLHLGRERFGHRRLALESFLLHGKQLLLADGENVRGGGLKMNHVLRLGHSAARFATTTDLLRAWQTLGPGSALPTTNAVSRKIWRAQVRQSLHDNNSFGRLDSQGWQGIFTRRADLPLPWAPPTRSIAATADWERGWPDLLSRMETDQLDIIKRGPSGDVLGGEVILGGKPFAVIIKRPRRKFWWRYLTDVGRPSRARRTWIKTWKMLVRNVPCEWPMLLMEKRAFGYVTDSVVVFAKVSGPTLAEINLDALPDLSREKLFYRAGRTLRRIESLGFTHMDAKSTNWIIFDDQTPAGPLPVLVDVDGVRHYRWATAGILRLLRAMKQHPQYTPADSLELCRGYAPRAAALQEPEREDVKPEPIPEANEMS